MRSPSVSPYLLLTLTALFWSGNFVLARAVHSAIPPLTLSFWRWAIALLVLLPFILRPLKAQLPLLQRQWRRVLVLALLGVSGFNTLVYLGTQYTTATNALLLNAFIPVITVLVTWLFMAQHLSRVQLGGVALSVVGVMVILSRGDLQVLQSLSFNRGDLLIFVAAILWALYTVFLKGLDRQINRIVFLGVISALGLLAIVPFYLWELHRLGGIALNHANLLSLAYVGVFPSVLAFIFYNRGVATVGPERSSLFIHLMPVFGTVLSVVFLDERFRLFHLIGAAAIFSGIYLTTRRTPVAK